MKKLLWKGLVAVVTFAAAAAARNVATVAWSKVADTDEPVNPADTSVSWPAATGWALLAGAAGGIARVLGRRGSAAAWKSATGEHPPGVQVA
ncbi:MAG: DUF4235 domain-containing protein [Acidimicrobiia bacterium]|nr:DUF4235 domain-containing protein [Acidimicrobiia bacterium]MBT8248991.1 DUF4235 domain-containing protein [Acidimicrobiia bacterium]NNC42551.1 DUF4235 domain-containing protein [Acidimicrobiia bacterium]NND14521.1 DUF4235 domain-containing protein [Acidimicrobiia bacterium]NNL27163.1 DUF4235 domain-containing protein [Acidimicrobiia bacterium]